MADKKRPTKEETKAKLRAFLKGGERDDVASVLVHTLMQDAEKSPVKKPAKPKAKKPKPKK